MNPSELTTEQYKSLREQLLIWVVYEAEEDEIYWCSMGIPKMFRGLVECPEGHVKSVRHMWSYDRNDWHLTYLEEVDP